MNLIRVLPNCPLPPSDLEAVARAAAQGQLVIFPTDTVYGVGTNGLLPRARARLYAAKGRDSAKPLPILVHSTEEARRWVEFTPAAERLAGAFWPGPLTLVLRPTEAGKALMQEGSTTLAIRVPAHALARALVAASGVPWASTSANVSGEPAAKDGAQAAAALGSKADWVVDAGPSGGVESSVVNALGPGLKVLREGALSRAKLEAAVAEQ